MSGGKFLRAKDIINGIASMIFLLKKYLYYPNVPDPKGQRFSVDWPPAPPPGGRADYQRRHALNVKFVWIRLRSPQVFIPTSNYLPGLVCMQQFLSEKYVFIIILIIFNAIQIISNFI
jgi:hypothetical protein